MLLQVFYCWLYSGICLKGYSGILSILFSCCLEKLLKVPLKYLEWAGCFWETFEQLFFLKPPFYSFCSPFCCAEVIACKLIYQKIGASRTSCKNTDCILYFKIFWIPSPSFREHLFLRTPSNFTLMCSLKISSQILNQQLFSTNKWITSSIQSYKHDYGGART